MTTSLGNAYRDENNVPTLLATLSTDGVTTVRIQANASNNSLKVSDGSTGSDHGRTPAIRDQNNIPVLIATSSTDGVTPVEVYSDSSGNLLIQTT